MALEAVPGFIELKDAHRETTVVVDPAELVAAALHLRDALGFDFLSDITAVDYLGWGGKGVSGYIGTRAGREFFIGSLHVWSNAARLNCPSNIQATGALRPAPVLMRG